jgi:hypothetical protein
MTAPANDAPENASQRRSGWFGLVGGLAVGVMAAIAVAIYLGLVARGTTWPVFVFAVASAPLALLAAAQGVAGLARVVSRKKEETQVQT